MVLAMLTSTNVGSHREGEEHTANLRWSFFRPTGLDLSVGDGFTLRVKSVDSSGVIGDWNRDNPTAQVQSGDIIVDVNGKTRSSCVMLQEIKSSWNLRLLVRRIPDMESQIRMMQYRDLDPEDFELLRTLDENNRHKTEGALKSTLDALLRLPAHKCRSRTCGVCLEDFSAEVLVTQLPCNHAFCTQCIESWLRKCKSNCPICQSSVDEASVTQSTTCSTSSSESETLDYESMDIEDLPVSEEVDRHGLAVSARPVPRLAIGGATRGQNFGEVRL